MNEFTEAITPENTGQDMQSFFDGEEELTETSPEAAETEATAAPPADGNADENAEAPPDVPEAGDETAADNDRLSELRKELLERFDGLQNVLRGIGVQLSAANRAVAVHEEIEKNLNNELQKYKNEFYDKLASPFLMQFIGLYIDMTEELDELRSESENAADNEFLSAYIKSLEYYSDSVRGVLTNNSVEIKTPAVGDKYDYLEHRISKTVPSEDPELRDCIAAVRSSAFVYNGKVLRPAKVMVYKVK